MKNGKKFISEFTTIRLLYHLLYPLLRCNTFAKTKNFLIAKVQKWLKVDKVCSRPYRYFIDPINICNLSCSICPNGLGILGREHGKMDFDDFTRIIDQVEPYAYLVELCNWGEPFLHPHIFDMISYAHNHRIAVWLSSNFNHFDCEMAEKAVLSGLNRISIAVDGSTQEVYEKYRRDGNLAKVLRNIHLLVEERERRHSFHPFIIVRMLVNRYNEHQIDEVRQVAMNLGADVFSTGFLFFDTTDITQFEEWLPKNESLSCYDYSTEKIENTWHCSDLWENMVINWDGGVAPCCWLHYRKNDFGNIFKSSLEEIWNNEAYVSSRRIFGRRKEEVSLKKTICALCKGKPPYLKI
jgi:radical SAM protein with 4Fe4S-binding SPASM domain